MKKPSIFEKYPFIESSIKLVGAISILVGCATYITTLNVKADSNERSIKDKVSSKELALILEKYDFRFEYYEKLLNEQKIYNQKQIEINQHLINTNADMKVLININKSGLERVSSGIDNFKTIFENYDKRYFKYKNQQH